jgi:hypothetical protein
MIKSRILKIYESPQTVFTPKDIAILIGASKVAPFLIQKIHYYIKTGKLVSLRRGFYAKNNAYNPYELGQKIYTPSYVSFETVLREAGVIFQYYDSIFLASYLSRNIVVKEHKFTYRRLTETILMNREGLIEKDGYTIATPERALLDMLYLFPNYYFDNLGSINWDRCIELLGVYNNKDMEKLVIKLRKGAENAK